MLKFLKKYKSKEFDIEEYLISNGFVKIYSGDKNIYTNNYYEVVVVQPKSGYNTFIINVEQFNLCYLKFIPNSRVMMDMIMANIRKETDDKEEV